MIKLNKKIDINQVIIAPVYALKRNELEFKNSVIHRYSLHVYNNEFAALIPMPECETLRFYNLSNNFEEISSASSGIKLDKRIVNLKEAKPLTDYLNLLKFSFPESGHISYKKLLYIIEPITKLEEYRHNTGIKKIKNGKKKYMNADVALNNDIFNNCVLEKDKHFAIHSLNGLPVSYEYINDDIPYVLKKRI